MRVVAWSAKVGGDAICVATTTPDERIIEQVVVQDGSSLQRCVEAWVVVS